MARATTGREHLTNPDGTAFTPRQNTHWNLGPNERVIGVRDASLVQATSAGTGPLTQTTAFKSAGDWVTLRSDAARLLLTNSTGGSVTLAEVTIRGKPVTQLSGDEGYIHDSFVDWESVEKIGERLFEFGNTDVVTKAQLESLADFWWKYMTSAKHIYVLTMSGMRQYMQPGGWYRLQIGGAGEAEYIDATVECYNVRMTRASGEIGQTVGIFREVQEAWKKDSTAAARFVASGGAMRLYSDKLTVTIGSATFTGNANIYCDGTADEVQINAVIVKMNAAGIHGTVHLTAGTFTLSAAIEMRSGVTLEGEAASTIIDIDANDYAIEAVGGTGTELTGIVLRDFTVRRSDTTSQTVVYASYSDEMLVENISIESQEYGTGMYVASCDNMIVSKVRTTSCVQQGIYFTTSVNLRVSQVTIDNQNATLGLVYGLAFASCDSVILSDVVVRNAVCNTDAVYCVLIAGFNFVVSNVIIENIDSSVDNPMHGLYVTGADNVLSSIRVIDVDSGHASSYGVYISGDNNVFSSVMVSGCEGTGVFVDTGADRTQFYAVRSTSNGTNYTDSGTNTQGVVDNT